VVGNQYSVVSNQWSVISDWYPASGIQNPASGFTMIEIAISLAIIGFALVAIIGILPVGMNVQKENREETIVNQDASVFMEALRNGARGTDDLTNYVMAITNYLTQYNRNGVPAGPPQRWGFTYNGSTVNGSPSSPQFGITNGYRIIGLMSTPKLTVRPGTLGFFSNHVIAYVRSLSGPVSEKSPQTNSTVQDLGLSYHLICDVTPYGTNFFDPSWLYRGGLATNNPDFIARFNYSNVIRTLEGNLRDVRLTFRWPILPNGDVGSGRQVYRTMVGGWLMGTNDFGIPTYYNPPVSNFLFFLQPRTYAQVP
jgi:type II secretory pathway pseudopilin PulG